jgi:hypothetical protein
MDGCHLVDVEQVHRDHPTTFEIVERAAREGMRVGDFVKLIVNHDERRTDRPAGERMWFEIVRQEGERYVGKLDNVPSSLPMRLGAEVAFGPEHILELDPRGQLRLAIPSEVRPGYAHPEGRHVSILEEVEGVFRVAVHTYDTNTREMWEEQLVVRADAMYDHVLDADPLDPRQFFGHDVH